MSAVLLLIIYSLVLIISLILAYLLIWLEEKYKVFEKLTERHKKEKDNDRVNRK